MSKIKQIVLQDGASWMTVGAHGITEIKETERGGEHSMIPYVAVYHEGELAFEVCMHKLAGIYYFTKENP